MKWKQTWLKVPFWRTGMVSVAPLAGVCLSLCLSLCLSRDSLPPNWDSNSHHNRPQQPVFSPAGREKTDKNFTQFAKPNRSRHLDAEKRAVVGNKVISSPPRWPGFPEAQLLFSAQQRHKLRFSFQVTWAERAARPVLRAVPCVTNTHAHTSVKQTCARTHSCAQIKTPLKRLESAWWGVCVCWCCCHGKQLYSGAGMKARSSQGLPNPLICRYMDLVDL